MAASINAYVVGNRIRVDIKFATDPEYDGTFNVATDPSTAAFKWKNLDTNEEKDWSWDGATATNPTGCNATFDHVATGEFAIEFDCEVAGAMVVRAEGTGACKAAGEHKFKITESALAA